MWMLDFALIAMKAYSFTKRSVLLLKKKQKTKKQLGANISAKL